MYYYFNFFIENNCFYSSCSCTCVFHQGRFFSFFNNLIFVHRWKKRKTQWSDSSILNAPFWKEGNISSLHSKLLCKHQIQRNFLHHVLAVSNPNFLNFSWSWRGHTYSRVTFFSMPLIRWLIKRQKGAARSHLRAKQRFLVIVYAMHSLCIALFLNKFRV